MIVNPHGNARQRAAGFGLFEMIVNLGLMAGALVMIASVATWASGTVSETSGRLAASEKAESVRRLLAEDLAAVPAAAGVEPLVRCASSAGSWKLDLRLPSRAGGWREVTYHWSGESGKLTRAAQEAGKRSEKVIGTGFSMLASRWLDSAADAPEAGTASWNDKDAPALLRLELRTTNFREEGKRERVREVRADHSGMEFLLPVGGGPAAL